jgi:LysM repeat protein
MLKFTVAGLALCLALTGCSMFSSEKPAPEPVAQVQPEPAPAPTPPPAPPTLSHTVKKGETVAVLAKKYGVSVKEILEANNLPNAKAIRPGRVLTIPCKPVSVFKPMSKAEAKEMAEKESMEKQPKGKGGKLSKSDTYGIEAAMAPEKGKKKPVKVYDEAAFEKVKSDFNDYARNFLEKESSLAESNKNHKDVKQEDGRYVATYNVILMNTMQTEVKRVDYSDTPFVGHITYQMEVHSTYGATAQEALASTAEEVKQESMREIFSYSGQKCAWR